MFVRVIEDEVTELHPNHETYEPKKVGTKNCASVEFANLGRFYLAHYHYYIYIMARKFLDKDGHDYGWSMIIISVKEKTSFMHKSSFS